MFFPTDSACTLIFVVFTPTITVRVLSRILIWGGGGVVRFKVEARWVRKGDVLPPYGKRKS